MRGVGIDELIAYARREIDAAVAATRVCDAVVASGDGTHAWCALIAHERVAGPVLAGRVDDATGEVLAAAVEIADTRRMLLDRAEDASEIFAKLPEAVDWIAIEPIASKNGVQLGALVAMGERKVRSDILGVLPGAALVCETIAFELFCQALLGRKVHRFNNVLAKLSANVEQLSSLIAMTNGELSGADRNEVVMCARFAAESLDGLLDAGAELRGALPMASSPTARRPRT
jgi:hypothetical protein